MGRHAVVSSPLRSPAVLVGVPVATVLATCCSTVALGGVVPSAEEIPLAAASTAPAETGAPVQTPSSGPAAAAIEAVGDGLGPAPVAPPAPARREVATPAQDVRAAPRVVLVADEPAASRTTDGPVRSPASGERGIRVIDTGRERGDDATRALSSAPRATPATAVPQAPTVDADGPRVTREAASVPSTARSSPVPTTTAASAEDASPAGSALDLDTASGGLSVLSFG